MKIQNPVLRGFNPDPSIIYADGVFYIATSTFEYSPSVNIYRSLDLCNFQLIKRPLINTDMIDLQGIQISGGVWAPCLSYNEKQKRFYLLFSNMHSWKDNPFKDCDNFLTYADRIDGEWSKPVYINSCGFDSSLFHDEDKIYYMTALWDYRPKERKDRFGGIYLGELDTSSFTLKNGLKKIFSGNLGKTEGPHIYKKDGYYYLFTAEGGTGWGHAVTVARSKDIYGEYTLHPDGYILTSGDSQLKKSGHGSLVKDSKNDYYMAHLCSRPLDNGRCILGRETAIQNIIWKDGWCYIKDGVNPKLEFDNNRTGAVFNSPEKIRYTFEDNCFLKDFYSLRLPFSKERFFTEGGYLKMIGKDSIISNKEQNILVRRQSDFCFRATLKLKYRAESFLQMAGLLYRYDEKNQYFLYITYDEQRDCNVLSVMSFIKGEPYILNDFNQVKAGDEVFLKLEVNRECGNFLYSFDGTTYYKIMDFDASVLSDDFAGGFTGAMVGMAAVDMFSKSKAAEFMFFEYQRL